MGDLCLDIIEVLNISDSLWISVMEVRYDIFQPYYQWAFQAETDLWNPVYLSTLLTEIVKILIGESEPMFDNLY